MKKTTCAILFAFSLSVFPVAAQSVPPANLVQNGDFSETEDAGDINRWRSGYCFLHDASIPADSPMRQDVKKAVKWEIRDGTAVIVKSPELLQYCNGRVKIAKNVSGGYSKFIPLVQTNGGTYSLSIQYSRIASGPAAGNGYVLVSMYEKPENKSLFNILPKGKLLVFPLAVTGEKWNTFQKEITIPAGINYLNLVVRIDGVGELKFKAVSMTEKK